MKGIDVSTIQNIINWNTVKKSGVEFAMIKATQGRGEGVSTKNLRLFTDSKFTSNIRSAASAGLQCGVYHYFTAQNDKEAKEEAAYFIKVIKPYKRYIDLWAAVDVESEPYLSKVNSQTLTSATKTFMSAVKAAGFKPMLYTNPNYLKYRFTPGAFNSYDVWLAHWGVSKPMSVPNMQIWQYGTDRIDGINTVVDVNRGYFKDSIGVSKPSGAVSSGKKKYKVGDKYTIKATDKYTNGDTVPDEVVGWTCTVIRVKTDSILLKEIYTWVKI